MILVLRFFISYLSVFKGGLISGRHCSAGLFLLLSFSVSVDSRHDRKRSRLTERRRLTGKAFNNLGPA